MSSMSRLLFIGSVICIILLITLFAGPGNKATDEQEQTAITVFSAAGMTNAIEAIAHRYEIQTGRKILFDFDSSSRLARQIQAGARADLFISANDKWIDLLLDHHVIVPEHCKKIASTDLVLIVPVDSLNDNTVRLDLNFAKTFTGSLAVGDYTHVPAGVYAKQVMDNLGIFDLLKDKLALSSTVSDALHFVEREQCQAGIVYRSSAVASPKVRIAQIIPEELHSPVVFNAAVCNPDNTKAFDFLNYIISPENVKLLRDYGFEPIHSVSEAGILSIPDVLNDDEWAVLKLSIRVALFCVLVIAVPGTIVGWFLARTSFRGKMLLESIIHLPLIMPPVVTGYLALIMLGKKGLIGRFLYDHFEISLPFTWYAAVIASAIMGFPLLIRSVKVAVQLIDERLEKAASTLGAHPLRVFITVTLPLALPGIISGMVLAFARSLGEFGATTTFAGNIPGKTRTLSLAIHNLTQIPGREHSALRLVCISIMISVMALIFSDLMSRKLLSRTGRQRYAGH